jgi:AcrR family transcriptional regulator
MANSTPGKRGPYRAGVARRKLIIEQAAITFGESGYYGGTMREVAERAGVTPAALSRYFGSKEEMLFAVMDYNLEQWRAYVDRVAGPDRVGLAYVRAIPRVVEYFEQNPGVARLMAGMTGEASSPDHPAHSYIVQSYRSTQESFARHVAEAVEKGEIPPFTPEQITLEAAQLGMMLHGSLSQIVVQSGVAAEIDYPPASAVFAAFVESTCARWRAALALGI